MLNLKELEAKLREAHDKAHEECMTVGAAYLATNLDDRDLAVKDAVASHKCDALFDALMLIEDINWNSDKTADEVAAKIVARVTEQATYVGNRMFSEDDNNGTKEQAA